MSERKMIFVIWWGDRDRDPLDRGVEDFATRSDARNFIERMQDKGYNAFAYSGEHIVIEREPDRGEQCSYIMPWVGACKNTVPCNLHSEQMCTKCKKKLATHGCGHAGSLVCGRPLCDDCSCIHVGL
jgi:hypothetical protein